MTQLRKLTLILPTIIVGSVFIFFGSLTLIEGINNFTKHNEKSKTYIETTSIVVDHVYNDSDAAAIVVEYEVDNQTYSLTSSVYSSPTKSLGTEVKVKYNPDDPAEAIWANDSADYILLIVGSVFILVAIISIIKGIKRLKYLLENEYE